MMGRGVAGRIGIWSFVLGAVICWLAAAVAARADSQQQSGAEQASGSCVRAERQFQRVVLGNGEATVEFTTDYCNSACVDSLGDLLGVAPEGGPRWLKLRAMQRLCLQKEGTFCFPSFAAAVRILARAEDDSLSDRSLRALCNPCARDFFGELLDLPPDIGARVIPLERLCRGEEDFCIATSRSFLEELVAWDTECDLQADADCRSELLDFADWFCQRDACIDPFLLDAAAARFIPVDRTELQAIFSRLREFGCKSFSPDAPELERMRNLQKEANGLQQALYYALILFQPQELLEVEFFGDKL